MGLLNKLVESIADDLWKTAILITQRSNRKTVGHRDAQTATRIFFTRSFYQEVSDTVDPRVNEYIHSVKTSSGRQTVDRKHAISRNERAGLVFPVGRVERIARSKHLRIHQRISSTCAVYITAVLEHVANTVILASQASMELSEKRILTPRHFLVGISDHPSLKCVVQNYNIINAGVVPSAHTAIEKPRRKRSQTGGNDEYDEPECEYNEEFEGGYDDEFEGGYDDEYDDGRNGAYETSGGYVYDGIQHDITKPGVIRLMRRAGVQRVGSGTYETSLSIIHGALEMLLKATTAMTVHKRLSTVRAREVEDAIAILNEVSQVEIFKTNLQGPCLSDMSVTKRNRSPKSKASASNEEDGLVEDAPKRHKRPAKPGAKALRDIRHYQETSELLLQPTGFSKAIRQTGNVDVPVGQERRYGSAALRLLQSIVENYLVGILQEANLAAAHAKRKTISEQDIWMVQRANQLAICA